MTLTCYEIGYYIWIVILNVTLWSLNAVYIILVLIMIYKRLPSQAELETNQSGYYKWVTVVFGFCDRHDCSRKKSFKNSYYYELNKI